jgi:DNA replication protein DnaC
MINADAVVKAALDRYVEKTETEPARAEDLKGRIDVYRKTVLADIPRRYRPFMDEPIQETDLEMLSRGNILTVLGDVGVGKTVFAFRLAFCFILKTFIERGLDYKKVRYNLATADDYIFKMREAYESNDAGYLREEFKKSSILLLDDLFASMITDSVHSEILNLIDYRSAWLGPTIITTNKGLNDLKAIDARIPSRLVAGHVIKFDGADKRLAS